MSAEDKDLETGRRGEEDNADRALRGLLRLSFTPGVKWTLCRAAVLAWKEGSDVIAFEHLEKAFAERRAVK